MCSDVTVHLMKSVILLFTAESLLSWLRPMQKLSCLSLSLRWTLACETWLKARSSRKRKLYARCAAIPYTDSCENVTQQMPENKCIAMLYDCQHILTYALFTMLPLLCQSPRNAVCCMTYGHA